MLSPKKSGTGHRLYRRKDVELLLRIKHLLYEKRFTIEGARQSLQAEAQSSQSRTPSKRVQQELFCDRSVTRNPQGACRNPATTEVVIRARPRSSS